MLVGLKSKLCAKIGLDHANMKKLIDSYTVNEMKGINNSKSQFTKMNYYQQFYKPRMTIKTFFKFLRVINVVNVKLSVTITTVRGREITVEDDINLFAVQDSKDD